MTVERSATYTMPPIALTEPAGMSRSASQERPPSVEWAIPSIVEAKSTSLEPELIVGTSDGARARVASLQPGLTPPEGVGLVAVFQGQQRTGGFAIRVTRIERDGDRLVVRAIFASPLPNAIVSQALSSPVHIVSISASALSGVREAVLLDDSGAERARAGLT